MKTILIISFSNLLTDPRVHRQIRFLAPHYRVIACGFGDPEVENVEFIPLTEAQSRLPSLISALQLLLHRYEDWYWKQEPVVETLKKLSPIHADLILANDVDTLPLALHLSKGAKVLLDAHEYAPREADDLLVWKIFFQKYKVYMCSHYIPKVDGMTAVCQTIAETYEKDTGIRPRVITNAPDFEEIEPCKMDSQRTIIRLIHHGGAAASRKTENMIKMMDHLDERFELNLMLVSAEPKYMRHLKRLSARKPNIHFLPPQPMRALSKYLNQFDIGIYILEPTNFNNRYALPNKFFEFIQARLAVAIGPSPEMARIVNEHDLGVVSSDFSPQALAHSLKDLDREKINHYKWQSHKVAQRMSADQNRKILLDLVRQVLGE